MATTYLGVRRYASVEWRFCLKDLKEELWADPEFRSAFLWEAEVTASLRHANIVGVVDVDPELGRLVLELVDGVDLWRLVSSVPGHQLSAELVTELAYELCRALEYAHGRRRRGAASGVVHRDLSASNVLISYAGDVKLTDFGLATLIRGREESYSAVIRGKVHCLSPEQSRAERLDGRSDLWALGVLCYELLVGRRPFDGATDDDTIHAIRAGRRRRLSEFGLSGPPALFKIVDRLLATEREERFASAEAVLDELAQIAGPRRDRELGALAKRALPPKTMDYAVLERRSSRPVIARPRPATRWLAMVGGMGVVASAGFGVSQTLRATSQVEQESGRKSAAVTPVFAAAGAALAPKSEAPELPQLAAPATGAAESPRSAEPESVLEAHAPEAAGAPASTPEASRPSAAAAEATVNIGVTPWPLAQIWIDGQPRGRGPLHHVSIKPGRHTISAGRASPERSVRVRLRAGQSRDLLIDLNAPADALPDAAEAR